MRNKYPLFYIGICMFTLLLAACVKDPVQLSTEDYCNQLHHLHAHPFTPVDKGQEIDISADNMQGATYYWSGPNNFQSYNPANTLATYADYTYRGWYYVNMSYDECGNNFDSVYVDVKFPQGTPACSPTNNTATFTSALFLGDQSYYYESFGPAIGGYGVTANSSNGDMDILMSGYWNTNEPEDGIYYTTSSPIPDYAQIDQIHISNVNQGIYWTAEPGKPIYISHVGGKQRITFCGIDFSGDGGSTLYHTIVDAKITQP